MTRDINKNDKEKIINLACKNFKYVSLSDMIKFEKLPYWLRTASYHFKNECENKLPKYYYHFKRGSIINVNFGVNPGSEFSFTHLAIVLDKHDNNRKKTLTVLPLTSKKNKNRYSLGRDIFNQTTELMKKQEKVFEKEASDLVKEMNTIKKLHKSDPQDKEIRLQLNSLGSKTTDLSTKAFQLKQVLHIYMNFNKNSYVRLSDITTISKLRINRINKYDPSGYIRLNEQQMKDIDLELAKLFLDKI